MNYLRLTLKNQTGAVKSKSQACKGSAVATGIYLLHYYAQNSVRSRPLYFLETNFHEGPSQSGDRLIVHCCAIVLPDFLRFKSPEVSQYLPSN
jgi:hypothetical protein